MLAARDSSRNDFKYDTAPAVGKASAKSMSYQILFFNNSAYHCLPSGKHKRSLNPSMHFDSVVDQALVASILFPRCSCMMMISTGE